MDINQIYKAPSIPKLSKRNISSSVLRASSAVSSSSPITPRLRTSRFSFIKPKVGLQEKLESLKPIETLNAEKIFQKKEDRETETYKALVETNRILVEIQKQLALDFAMRIAEEKESVKKIKAAESKRKFTAKESAVEGVKKIGSIGKNIVDKVTAPVKSVFDKIKEFFGLILTGIVYNTAFNWLQDPNNKKLLDDIFYWIGKAFVPAVITIIGFKVFKWVRRLFLLGKFLWKLPGRMLSFMSRMGNFMRTGRFTPTPTSAGGTRGGLFRTGESARRGITTQAGNLRGSDRYFGAGKPGLMEMNREFGGGPVQQYTRSKTLLGKSLQFVEVGAKKLGRNLLGAFGVGFGKKTLTNSILKFIRPFLKRIPLVGALIDFGLSVALGEDPGRAAFGAIGAALLGAIGTFIGGPVGTLLGGLAGDWAGGALYDLFFRNQTVGNVGSSTPQQPPATPQQQKNLQTYRNAPRAQNLPYTPVSTQGFAPGAKPAITIPGKKNGGTIHAANGMTVPGIGSGLIDTIPAMLAVGEEVIRASEAMRWRPLLKDINDKGGALWTLFSQAVSKLLGVTDNQKNVSQEFSKVIEDFDKYLKDDILKKKTSKPQPGGGGSRISSMAPQPSIAPAPRITNISMNVSGGSGGMTFLPMVLPKQSSKPPQIPQMQGKATDVPVISPINFANPYMELTPELYNIQMMYG